MRFKYSTNDSTQSQLDSLPRLPLTLRLDHKIIKVNGLVDSGATVNVLPYSIGVQLGAIWSDQKAVIQLAGSLGNLPAQPLSLIAEIDTFEAVKLVFAWSKNDNVPLTNIGTNEFLHGI